MEDIDSKIKDELNEEIVKVASNEMPGAGAEPEKAGTDGTAGQQDARDEQSDEEDPLIRAQREQEEKEKALEAAKDVNASDDPAMKVCALYFEYLICYFC